jgi:hypothetical protein
MTLDDLRKLKGSLQNKSTESRESRQGRSLEELILAAQEADNRRDKKRPKRPEEKADLEYQRILEAFQQKEPISQETSKDKY